MNRPADLREALVANASALVAWKNITPLARHDVPAQLPAVARFLGRSFAAGA